MARSPVQVVGRFDLIALKMLAASDPLRGHRDMTDLRVLAPNPIELVEAAQWALQVRYMKFRADIVFIANELGVPDADEKL